MTIMYATVTNINPLRVRFNYELVESKTSYHKLANYVPKVGDVVAILKDDKNKYLIIGGVQ